MYVQKSTAKLNNELAIVANQCETKESELMKQFGETDISEFNYDTCCTIFRNLIDQVEKERKVK